VSGGCGLTRLVGYAEAEAEMSPAEFEIAVTGRTADTPSGCVNLLYRKIDNEAVIRWPNMHR
jgi:hypothetical protein